LKRRQPTPDESTGTSDSNSTPSDKKPSDPPKLKRNTGDQQSTQPSTQPNSTP